MMRLRDRTASGKAFTVALIGADGSGKTTVGRTLERTLPVPVKYIYMGTNPGVSNALLPTTRLIRVLRGERGAYAAGLPPGAVTRSPAKGRLGRVLRETRSLMGLGNRFAEEWFRQGLAWYHMSRGTIVVFDRHFYIDFYDHDIAVSTRERSWSRTIHGLMLKHVYPRPDLVILLDAPAEVLWERKREGTLEALVRRREEYLRLRDRIGSFAIVDAAQSEEVVVRQVTRVILDRHQVGRRHRNVPR
jgi:thymidylate kinase